MNIKKSVFKKIEKRLFKCVEDSDNAHKDDLRFLLLYEKEGDDQICEIAELHPCPAPSQWGMIFKDIGEEIYDEVKRVPVYAAILMSIQYQQANSIEEAQLKSALSTNDGFILTCLEIPTGKASSLLYNYEKNPVEDSDKDFSLFDYKDTEKFPPAMALGAYAFGVLSRDKYNEDKAPVLSDLIGERVLKYDVDEENHIKLIEDNEPWNEDGEEFKFTNN